MDEPKTTDPKAAFQVVRPTDRAKYGINLRSRACGIADASLDVRPLS